MFVRIYLWVEVPFRRACCRRKRRRSMVEAKSHWTHCGARRSHRWESGNIFCWKPIATTAAAQQKHKKRDVQRTTITMKMCCHKLRALWTPERGLQQQLQWKQTTTNVKAASVAGKTVESLHSSKKLQEKSRDEAYKNGRLSTLHWNNNNNTNRVRSSSNWIERISTEIIWIKDR